RPPGISTLCRFTKPSPPGWRNGRSPNPPAARVEDMMTLGELLEGLNITELRGDAHVPVESLCWDSRGAVPGSVFFALPGMKADGAKFAAQAVEKGAVAVVTESADLFPGVPVAVTSNARQVM